MICPSCHYKNQEHDKACLACNQNLSKPSQLHFSPRKFRDYALVFLPTVVTIIAIIVGNLFIDDVEKNTSGAIVICAASMGFLALYYILQRIKFHNFARQRKFAKVKGVIVDHYEEQARSPIYHPIIQYIVDKKKYRLVHPAGAGSKQMIDRKATLFYNPKDPYEAYPAHDYTGLRRVLLSMVLSIIFWMIYSYMLAIA